MIGMSEQYEIKTMPFGKHKGTKLENLEKIIFIGCYTNQIC